MASFVDVNDYLNYFGLDDTDVARAALDLDVACDKIRDYLHQQIDAVAADAITLFGTDTRALILPELPVTAVTSVTLDGEALTDWTVDAYGLLWRDDPAYWARGYQYDIVYDHGYATEDIPSILKVVAFQLTYAGSVSSSGIRQESIADYSVTYATESGTDSILAALDRRIAKRVPTP